MVIKLCIKYKFYYYTTATTATTTTTTAAAAAAAAATTTTNNNNYITTMMIMTAVHSICQYTRPLHHVRYQLCVLIWITSVTLPLVCAKNGIHIVSFRYVVDMIQVCF